MILFTKMNGLSAHKAFDLFVPLQTFIRDQDAATQRLAALSRRAVIQTECSEYLLPARLAEMLVVQ